MRAVVTMISLAAALALANTTAAAPNKTAQLNTTLSDVGCTLSVDFECGSSGGGSCLCQAAYWQFGGSTTIPALGTFKVKGRYEEGNFCRFCTDAVFWRIFTLTLTAPTGDQLVLSESYDTNIQPLQIMNGDNFIPGEWTVDQGRSTGKFAQYTGSGTYTLSYESHYTNATFTIALAAG